MSRKLPARLEIRESSGGRHWIIRDENRRIATGCPEADVTGAQTALADYLTSKGEAAPAPRFAGVPAAAPTPMGADPFLADVLDYYITHQGPEMTRREAVEWNLRRLNPFWGGLKMRDMTGPKYREYVEARKQITVRHKATKAVTAWKELKVLGTAVKYYCVEKGIMNFPRVVAPSGSGATSQPRERVLTRQEFARLLLAARRSGYKHLVRFLLIGRYTGTRMDCLLGLRWLPALQSGHIDTKYGVLHRRGGAEKATKKRKTACKLERKLLWFCRKWQEADAREGITHVIHLKGKAIYEVRAKWNGCSAQTPWSHIVEDAGLATDEAVRGKLQRSTDVTPHILRHTCISWGLWDGRSNEEMGELAGCTAKMVETVYGHRKLESEEYQRQKAERLAAGKLKARG